jgi:hypothetical protein
MRVLEEITHPTHSDLYLDGILVARVPRNWEKNDGWTTVVKDIRRLIGKSKFGDGGACEATALIRSRSYGANPF